VNNTNDTTPPPIYVYTSVPVGAATIAQGRLGHPRARYSGRSLSVEPVGPDGPLLILRSPDEWRRIAEVVESAIAEGGSDAGH